MILSRRKFLTGLLPAAAGGLVLAEELLHPGRVFFLPPRRFTWQVYSDIIFPTPTDLVAEMKRVLARDVANVMDEVAFRTMTEGSLEGAFAELEAKRQAQREAFAKESVGLQWINRIARERTA
jgi:hypothetical protein